MQGLILHSTLTSISPSLLEWQTLSSSPLLGSKRKYRGMLNSGSPMFSRLFEFSWMLSMAFVRVTNLEEEEESAFELLSSFSEEDDGFWNGRVLCVYISTYFVCDLLDALLLSWYFVCQSFLATWDLVCETLLLSTQLVCQALCGFRHLEMKILSHFV